jgi:hypothetical protein
MGHELLTAEQRFKHGSMEFIVFLILKYGMDGQGEKKACLWESLTSVSYYRHLE